MAATTQDYCFTPDGGRCDVPTQEWGRQSKWGEWTCRQCGRVWLFCQGDHPWGPYWWEPVDEEA